MKTLKFSNYEFDLSSEGYVMAARADGTSAMQKHLDSDGRADDR